MTVQRDIVRLELTENHLNLLSRANIQFQGGCEWGYVGLDCKLPFGNSDVIGDMAKIVGLTPFLTDDGEVWPKGTADNMIRLFENDLPIALQIVLTCRTFTPGVYECDKYKRNWRPVNQ